MNIPAAFEEMRADYSAMRPSKFRRARAGMGGTGDAHYSSDAAFVEAREYARDMDRNDAVIGQGVNRACDNLIQTGFRLEPQTGDEKLNLDLWQEFVDWGSDPRRCDVAGEWTFADFEYRAKRAEYVDGDAFVLLSDDDRMEMVEACRCRTPTNSAKNIVHGVLLDEGTRERLGFYFTKQLVSPWVRFQRVSDARFIPARDDEGERRVLQIYSTRRATMTRGVTVFAPIFDIAGMVEDTQFSKLVQQQMSTVFAGFLERTADYQLGSRTEETLPDSTTALFEQVSPGMILRGNRGEKFTMTNSNVPNSEYLPHIRSLIMLIGLQLNLPLCMMLMDASETNFSGYRGAMEQARLSFKVAQKALGRMFHAPAYRWRLRGRIRREPAMAAAFRQLGPKLFAHRWDFPGWPYIDPYNDAQSDAFRLSHMLTSPRRLHSERGNDVDDVIAETIEDNSGAIQKAIEAAKAIDPQTPVVVTWRDILNWAPPERVVGATGQAAAKPAEKPEPTNQRGNDDNG